MGNPKYEKILFKKAVLENSKKDAELFQTYGIGTFQNQRELEGLYGIDIQELAQTEMGEKLGITARNRIAFLCSLAEVGVFGDFDLEKSGEGNDYTWGNSNITIEDILDCNSEKALERKRKAGELVKSIIKSGDKEGLEEFFRVTNTAFRTALNNYIDKVVASGNQEEVNKKLLQINDLVGGQFDGMNEADRIGIPKDVIENGAFAIYAVNGYNQCFLESAKHETEFEDLDEAKMIGEHYLSIITEKIKRKYYLNSLKSGDYKNVDEEFGRAVLSALNKMFDEAIDEGTGLYNMLGLQDLRRLASADSLYDKIEIKMEPTGNGINYISSFKLDGIELFGKEIDEEEERVNLSKVKNMISDAYYEDKSYDGLNILETIGKGSADLEKFGKSIEQDLLVNFPKLLDKNTKWYNSSDNYRDVQDEFERFGHRYMRFSFDRLDSESFSVEFKADLDRVKNSVKKYLDGKDAFNKDKECKNDYEQKRVDGMREIYRRLTEIGNQIDTYQRSNEYKSYKANIESSKFYQGAAKESASKICDLAFCNKELTKEQKAELKEAFLNICLDNLKNTISRKGDPSGKLQQNDELLANEIRKTPEFNKLFRYDEDINFGLAKTILERKISKKSGLENEVTRSLMKRLAKEKKAEMKNEESKQKSNEVEKKNPQKEAPVKDNAKQAENMMIK